MKPHLTPDDLYSLLLMMRNADSRTILLLEGDSDAQVLDPHVNEVSCRTIPGYGKTVVLGAMQIVQAQSMERVAALVDRDFEPASAMPPVDSAFYTDGYDLEISIANHASVAKKVLSNFTDRTRRERHLQRTGASNALELVLPTARAVAALRLVISRRLLPVSLEGFPIDVVLPLDGEPVAVQSVIDLAYRKARLPLQFPPHLSSEVVAAHSDLQPGMLSCSGHDVMRALAHVMHKRWGGSSMSGSTLAQCFGSALDCSGMLGMQFYWALAEWADERRTSIWSCTVAVGDVPTRQANPPGID